MTASTRPQSASPVPPRQHRKGIPLHTKILLGLLAGAAAGMLAKWLLGAESPTVIWLNHYLAGPVGAIFLNLLFMIVIPLVFASISLGVAGLGDLRKVGRIGGKTLAFFFITMAMSATMGLIMVGILDPGSRVTPEVRDQLMATYAGDASSQVETAAMGGFGIQTIVNIVTRNPFRSAVEIDLLGIIFFGIMFGVALTMLAPERAKPMIDVLDSLNEIVIKIVELAMKLAPYGVAGLIFGVTSRFGAVLLTPLLIYIAVVIGGLILHTFVNYPLILRFVVGISPWRFFTRIKAPMVTAFSTSSSSATLPTSIATAEQNLNIPPKIAGFVLPLGATMNMNGTSLFEGVTVIFVAQVFGMDLSLGQQIVVMLMAVITALGAAGVPGGSIPLLVGILVMFGVPAEGIAIILGVDRILDMARTTVNVTGDLVTTAFIARSEKLWDESVIPPEGVQAGGGKLDESPSWPPPEVTETPRSIT
ncbi:MAG: dicarboxylate/amino acid:cation symporter [Gemmatimonadaceae bacterium]